MTVTQLSTSTVLPALMYHSVSTVDGPLRDLAVPRDRLAEQLGALAAAGYRLVAMSDALDLVEGRVAFGVTDGKLTMTTTAKVSDHGEPVDA